MSHTLVEPQLLTRPASITDLLRWQFPSCDFLDLQMRSTAPSTCDPYDALADMTQGTEHLAILLRRPPN
jgi:hypothetical protein